MIKYGEPTFDAIEITEVVNSLVDGRLAMGIRNREFERELAAYVGVKDSVTVNSGSSALLLAFRCLLDSELKLLKNGDEVIVPALCHPADLNAVILNGLKPVSVDVEFGTWNISCEEVEKAISPRTKAILAIHFLGNPCDLHTLAQIADAHSLTLIEDCSHALGSMYAGRHVGCFGDMATFSFYPSHHISMGEGGAIAYGDDRYDDVLRSLRSWGAIGEMYDPRYVERKPRNAPSQASDPWAGRFVFPRIGFNMKITEMQAAFGLVQLKKLNEFNEKRRRNMKRIRDHLERYQDSILLPVRPPKTDPSWFAVGIVVKKEARFAPKTLAKFLDGRGIETRPFLAGDAIQQAAYRKIGFRTVGEHENTAMAAERGFFFGCHQGMSRAIVDYVLEQFDEFFREAKASS